MKSVPVVDHDDRVVGMLSRSDVVQGPGPRRRRPGPARSTRCSRRWAHGDWLAEVTDGVVELTGPDDSAERSLAQLVAGTVPGVVEVVGH